MADQGSGAEANARLFTVPVRANRVTSPISDVTSERMVTRRLRSFFGFTSANDGTAHKATPAPSGLLLTRLSLVDSFQPATLWPDGLD